MPESGGLYLLMVEITRSQKMEESKIIRCAAGTIPG